MGDRVAPPRVFSLHGPASRLKSYIPLTPYMKIGATTGLISRPVRSVMCRHLVIWAAARVCDASFRHGRVARQARGHNMVSTEELGMGRLGI